MHSTQFILIHSLRVQAYIIELDNLYVVIGIDWLNIVFDS